MLFNLFSFLPEISKHFTCLTKELLKIMKPVSEDYYIPAEKIFDIFPMRKKDESLVNSSFKGAVPGTNECCRKI